MLFKLHKLLLPDLLKSISDWFKLRLTAIFLLLFAGSLALSLALGSCNSSTNSNSSVASSGDGIGKVTVVRIGHQPHGAPILLKARGTLEKHLASMGLSVQWVEFPAGPPIMAAMAEGKVDMGMAGEVPPLFAQASGVPLVYVANEQPVPTMMGILVRNNSPIKTLADLKGKKITATKASAGHYLLIQALLRTGLTLDDVQAVYLPPPEGQEAFRRGEVDVWVGWDPFLAILEDSMPVRLLANGEGLTKNTNFYFATRFFASKYYDIVKIVIEEMRQVGIWASNHPQLAAKIIAANTNMKLATALKITKRNFYGAQPIQDRAIEEQQRIADTFFRLGLLPKQIRVEDVVWKGRS
ncbi:MULTISPECIES: sulfonate ABC transporter substrate-binding protein [Aerosakkonema]|uniref:sulfonate ABC transporter substrate-binding protein n=1 Tax=Aerosakkonema TaxID=1246629 RepID=UPI0035B8BA28